ncbi:hypothetical protein ACFP2T_41910 [Plantactinospora solaniradicis]|uniref:Transposase n=1 Tax=Plantactinospora solaniradicis TaxID=1723736 RepID=A0ABW1KPF2_9ACTN
MTPRHRESDTVVRRGPITKQESTLVRWAAVEAAQGARNAGWLTTTHAAIAEQRGRNIATVAVARKLLILRQALQLIILLNRGGRANAVEVLVLRQACPGPHDQQQRNSRGQPQRCGCRKSHPRWSGGTIVFVEESAESVVSVDVQGHRCVERRRDRGRLE